MKKKSLIVSDQRLITWLEKNSQTNCRANGLSSLVRQLISLGIILHERGFRINEDGQLLKKIKIHQVEKMLFNEDDNLAPVEQLLSNPQLIDSISTQQRPDSEKDKKLQDKLKNFKRFTQL